MSKKLKDTLRRYTKSSMARGGRSVLDPLLPDAFREDKFTAGTISLFLCCPIRC